jgi:hypothetical protein
MNSAFLKLAWIGIGLASLGFSAVDSAEPVLGSGRIKRSLWTSGPGFIEQCKKLADQNAEEKCHSQVIRISDYSTTEDTGTFPGFTLYSASAYYLCD